MFKIIVESFEVVVNCKLYGAICILYLSGDVLSRDILPSNNSQQLSTAAASVIRLGSDTNSITKYTLHNIN